VRDRAKAGKKKKEEKEDPTIATPETFKEKGQVLGLIQGKRKGGCVDRGGKGRRGNVVPK